jgi:predicted esterase YcpF (UPF0227 family)
LGASRDASSKNHCEAVAEIDASRPGLIGLSFGGYLAPRAAPFEPRIRAVVAIDGIFDAHESVTNILSEKLRDLLEDRHMDAFNTATREAIEHDRVLCWYIDQGLWSFGVSTLYEFLDRILLYIR